MALERCVRALAVPSSYDVCAVAKVLDNPARTSLARWPALVNEPFMRLPRSVKAVRHPERRSRRVRPLVRSRSVILAVESVLDPTDGYDAVYWSLVRAVRSVLCRG